MKVVRSCRAPTFRTHSRNFSGRKAFGINRLNSPQDWALLCNEAIAKSQRIIQDLDKQSQPLEIIKRLDNISEAICNVSDPAELCRNVHPVNEWRNAADSVHQTLSNYIHQLNANEKLYQSVTLAHKRLVPSDGEAFVVAKQLAKEFEVLGIHLPKETREEVIHIQQKISNLSNQFSFNIHNNDISNHIEVPIRRLEGLPETILREIPKKGSTAIIGSSMYVDPILRYVRDGEVRRAAYKMGNTVVPENLEILDELLYYRHQLAKLLSFPTFSDLTLANNRMMSSPTQVMELLNAFASKLKHKARSELDLLIKKKLEMEPFSTPQIFAWDKEFYMAVVKAEKFPLENTDLREYFSVNNCLRGLDLICRNLFSLQVTPAAMEDGETWDKTVFKLAIVEEASSQVLGYVYMDLFPRKDKFSHNATFSLELPKVNSSSGKLSNTPRVCMVCNLSGRNQRALLSHGEAETLFHEFGHCLSALLSRTHHHHVSGTRSALDFVETPSTLMEFFVWDHKVVPLFAKHSRTKQPLSEQALINMRGSKYLFSALETQEQLCYAVFDQILHTSYASELKYHSASKTIRHANNKSSTDVLQELQNRFTLIPFVEGTHWHSTFGHLVGYGCGYYSYLLCKIFSTSIWQKCFHGDPLSKTAGQQYRDEVLHHGGAKDPNDMLCNLLGQSPNIEFFLKEIQLS